MKRIPVIVGAGVAALVATKVVKDRRGEPAADLIPPIIPAPAALDVRPGEPSRLSEPSFEALEGAPESYRLEVKRDR